MTLMNDFERLFGYAADRLFGELVSDETAAMEFNGELSDFMRFNSGKVRQTGTVEQASATMTYYRGQKTFKISFPLSGRPDVDDERIVNALVKARTTAPLLPDDPYQTKPESAAISREVFEGRLVPTERIAQTVLEPVTDLDFVGIFSQGPVCRGAANSLGGRHWFATETFIVDYSAYLPNGKAVKSSHAGREWDSDAYRLKLSEIRPQLEALQRPGKVLPPGAYKVFIAADALAEFMAFFSWDGVSERSLREGESAFSALREGRKAFAPTFSLTQDFALGMEPRFNGLGEVAPASLPIIKDGRLANTMVSARSAKQYGVPSNAAPEEEIVRSPAIGAGGLDEAAKLAELGTGLYASNFHYCNWSDRETARITGMTRFACLWVENGQIMAPIQDMRFDVSLYDLFGSNLMGVTKQRHAIVNSETYFRRELGGALLPGILVKDFPFTL